MKRIYYHILFWLACLSLGVYLEVSWLNYNYLHIPAWQRFISGVMAELLLLPIKISLIYASFFIIRNYTLDKDKYGRAMLLLISLFLFAAMLSHALVIKVVFPYLYQDYLVRPFISTRIINSLIDLIFIAGIANAIKQYRYQVASQNREKMLREEKLKAELIFLKAQINPHFLFNTLNSVYALARKKSDETANVILKLSSLLRFILYESEKKSIPISQEIIILENYIELERIRYQDKLTIEFKKNVEYTTYQITPLLLLPFIENAFKHGAAEKRDNSIIHITLNLKSNGVMRFSVENNTENEMEEITERIGLKNVRRQLELVYPNHLLDISHAAKTFKINLQINLNTND